MPDFWDYADPPWAAGQSKEEGPFGPLLELCDDFVEFKIKIRSHHIDSELSWEHRVPTVVVECSDAKLFD